MQVWRKVCCKQGTGEKEMCELKRFSKMETHSFSIIACDRNTFYIVSWFSSGQAFFVFSWGWTFGKIWGFVCFSVNSGSQSKWQAVGMVNLHFAFSWRSTHRKLIDVHHRNSSGHQRPYLGELLFCHRLSVWQLACSWMPSFPTH